MLLALFGAVAFATPTPTLIDAGRARPEARPALLVVTPGVSPAAYDVWIDTIEDAGLDAWIVAFPGVTWTVDTAVAGLTKAFATLAQGREAPVVAAHGYAGVLVLLAPIEPAALALVGTPLGPQPVAVRTQPPPGDAALGLPWAPELLGPLDVEPTSGALGRAYAAWAVSLPDYATPRCRTLVVASGIDPVAPPEVVRLPSQTWPDRRWARVGMLGLDPEELTHGELLSDAALAADVAAFLRAP
jgi:hypothetical protein